MDKATPDIDLTSFMFGNAEQIFDQTELSQLGNIQNVIDIGDVLSSANSAVSATEDFDDTESTGSDFGSKASSAQDFYEMEECLDDVGCSLGRDSHNVGQEENEHTAMSNTAHALSALLPSEFRQIPVEQIFPEFGRDKVLRFCRLFGEGRSGSLPQLWRGCRNRRAADEESVDVSELDELKLDFAPTPNPSECGSDDEAKLADPRPQHRRKRRAAATEDEEKETVVAPWRRGPAEAWYDLIGVPESGEGFDYGFKYAPETVQKDDTEEPSCSTQTMDAATLFNLSNWEDEIVWNCESAKKKVFEKYKDNRQPMCAWVPSALIRNFDQFMHYYEAGKLAEAYTSDVNPNASSLGPPPPDPSLPWNTQNPDSSFCIFPKENLEFLSSKWEDDIIFDPDNVPPHIKPKVLTLDLTDPGVIVHFPPDMAPSSEMDKGEKKGPRKSQIVAGRVVTKHKEEDVESYSANQMVEKDPFNLSNDEYYTPINSRGVARGNKTQHSLPAQNLHPVLFPTHLRIKQLRCFHRPPLRPTERGSYSKIHRYRGICSVKRYEERRQKQREDERAALGGGEVFFMRKLNDLTCRDGYCVLLEYSEEYPPLITQPGMASQIRNYSKRCMGKDIEQDFEYGETAYSHSLPFLGCSLQPGESLQSLENNLFRAPVYRHEAPTTDFIMIKNGDRFWLRELPAVYLVGQEAPLYEVPSPNSKRVANFLKDFMMVFIYRLFWASEEEPKRLRMEEIKEAFPQYPEAGIRKRLKLCADSKRIGQGPDSSFWIVKPDFRLPSLDELRLTVTPEMCSAFYCMKAAEQRLKDAGYGERSWLTTQEDPEGDDVAKMEDEIKCAPWNTTRAYLAALKGKCRLDLSGVADPTGCGEGFSYIRENIKPPKEEQPTQAKRAVTGTDSDLRKLSLKNAKELLRNFGVEEEDVSSLSRWEIIDVIRTLSTQAAKAGGVGETRFARGNMKQNIADVQQRFKQGCQRIFDLQNRVLQSTEPLTSDEEEKDSDDSDIEEIGKSLETMLSKSRRQYVEQFHTDAEERERQELKQLIMGQSGDGKEGSELKEEDSLLSAAADTESTIFTPGGGRKQLKIYRSYRKEDGSEFTSMEVVTRPEVIDAYVRIRSSRDNNFIKHFVQSSQEFRDEKRKEKRRLQDKIRRLNRAQSEKPPPVPKKKRIPKAPSVPKVPKAPPQFKMKCSVCGAVGHMKTNKNCPMYGKLTLPPSQVAPTDEQLEEELSKLPSDKQLISVEGTKVKIAKEVVDHVENVRRKSLILKVPKKALNPKVPKMRLQIPKEQRLALLNSVSPTSTSPGTLDRRPTWKFPSGGSLTAQTAKRIKEGAKAYMPGSTKLKLKRSSHGFSSSFAIPTPVKKKKLSPSGLEYLRKPLKGVERKRTDPKVTISIIFEEILAKLRDLPCAEPFLYPVNKRDAPDYGNIIQQPMDLQKLKENISQANYLTRESFLKDLKLIQENSVLYNGSDAPISQKARLLMDHAAHMIGARENKLMRLEKAINPLLDSDEKAMSFIFISIVEQLKNIPKSYEFHQPVDKKKVRNYYQKVERPMDLGTMAEKAQKRGYSSVEGFLADANQIYQNSEMFNGPAQKSVHTSKALEIRDLCRDLVDKNMEQLRKLEMSIKETREKALDAAELESNATSFGGESRISDIFNESFETEPGGRPNEEQILEDTKISPDLFLGDEEPHNIEPSSSTAHIPPITPHYPSGGPNPVILAEKLERWQESHMTGESLSPKDLTEMEMEGKLHNDLALSDSDAEEEESRSKVRVVVEDSFDF